MPDPQDSGAPAATPNTPPSPETTPEASAPAATQETPQAGEPTTEESISLKEAKKLRKESQALRDRLAEAEEAKRKLEEAQMSDSERRDKRLVEIEGKYTALEQRHKEATTRYAVALASQKLGVVDAEVVAALIKPSELQYDEQGHPTNVEELVRDLIQDKPFLRATTQQNNTPPPSAGATTNPATQSPSNPNSPTVGLPTSFEDYLARKADIEKSLKQGTLV